MRLVSLNIGRSSYEISSLIDSRQTSTPNGLNQHITKCSCFHWTCNYMTSTGICGELAQKPILYAATNHVNRLERMSNQLLKRLQNHAIAKSQTLQGTANDLTFRLGNSLTGSLAVLANCGWHIFRCRKDHVIGIDHRNHALGFAGQSR